MASQDWSCSQRSSYVPESDSTYYDPYSTTCIPGAFPDTEEIKSTKEKEKGKEGIDHTAAASPPWSKHDSTPRFYHLPLDDDSWPLPSSGDTFPSSRPFRFYSLQLPNDSTTTTTTKTTPKTESNLPERRFTRNMSYPMISEKFHHDDRQGSLSSTETVAVPSLTASSTASSRNSIIANHLEPGSKTTPLASPSFRRPRIPDFRPPDELSDNNQKSLSYLRSSIPSSPILTEPSYVPRSNDLPLRRYSQNPPEIQQIPVIRSSNNSDLPLRNLSQNRGNQQANELSQLSPTSRPTPIPEEPGEPIERSVWEPDSDDENAQPRSKTLLSHRSRERLRKARSKIQLRQVKSSTSLHKKKLEDTGIGGEQRSPTLSLFSPTQSTFSRRASVRDDTGHDHNMKISTESTNTKTTTETSTTPADTSTENGQDQTENQASKTNTPRPSAGDDEVLPQPEPPPMVWPWHRYEASFSDLQGNNNVDQAMRQSGNFEAIAATRRPSFFDRFMKSFRTLNCYSGS